MKKDFATFFKGKNKNFVTALTNVILFLPYFFSIKLLLKTLFRPWKNLVTNRPKGPESLNNWFSRLSFNVISSLIGAMMRLGLIGGYILLLSILILFLPLLTALYWLMLPLMYVFSYFKLNNVEKKNLAQKEFVGTHMIDPQNKDVVLAWFQKYYDTYIIKKPWYEWGELFSVPPLARDWTFGYTPTLDQYGEDITLTKPHYKNLVDRENEIKSMEQILSKSDENNIILVGDEGIGKHTIVEGLAKKIYEGKSLPLLVFKRIIKLDMEKIMSQSVDFAQKESLFKTLLEEAAQAFNIIILIDDFELYISEGHERFNLTNIIAPYAKSEKLQFIGITNPFAYQKFIYPNEGISGLFEKVEVREISKHDALEILLINAYLYEKRAGVVILYETLVEVIEKSDYYITVIPFPEKALDLLDEACVYTAEILKQQAVTPDIVDIVLSQKTHTPVKIDQSLKQKLLNLDALLKQQIVQQEEAVKVLASTIRKSFIAASKRKKPLASLLFLGPTGVGKTQTAKALAKAFFGTEKSLLRFDMSLYQTKNDITTLIGSQDTGNPGLLVKVIRDQPYGVLLLDEFEKADKDLINIFLTVLDEGYFTDGFGKRVDCKNLIIIATSNAASDFIFQNIDNTEALSTTKLTQYLINKKILTPELLNRFDGVVVYKPLEKESVYTIAQGMIANVGRSILNDHGIILKFSDGFIKKIADQGFDKQFGARPLEHTIRDEVEDKVAKMILEGKAKKGDTVTF